MSMLSSVETGKMLQLAEFLESVPPRDFDLASWATRDAKEAIPPTVLFGLFTVEPGKPGCGFAGCAMGWAAHSKLFDGLYIDQTGQLIYKGAPSYSAADRLFGFDAENRKRRLYYSKAKTRWTNTAYFLFGPKRYDTNNPADVARRIRRMVAKIESRLARKAQPVQTGLRIVSSQKMSA